MQRPPPGIRCCHSPSHRLVTTRQLLLCRYHADVLGPSHHGGVSMCARYCAGMLTLPLRRCAPRCPGHRLADKAMQHHAFCHVKA
jgi:hypothetical protein